MRILNAIHAQNIGGVDQVFRNYNEVFLQNGHELALLISANGNENYDAKKIFKLKNYSPLLDFFHLLWVVAKFRPQIILCHSNRLMKWMRFLRFFSAAKSVAINHGITFKHSLNCHYIISINQQISDLVVEAGFEKEKSFVLQNVIKVDQKFCEKKIKAVPVIGIYGRIEPRKGFDILIKAAEILAKAGNNFRLKIGGFEVAKGYNLESLKALAARSGVIDKCDFVGTVFDKKNFFKDVDIFSVPSREEPFGIVILEGFLFSTLVISSNSDGGKFLIKDGENGLLFENGDAQELANKINYALQNPIEYGRLTRSAFSRLEKDFSFTFLATEIEKILLKISA